MYKTTIDFLKKNLNDILSASYYSTEEKLELAAASIRATEQRLQNKIKPCPFCIIHFDPAEGDWESWEQYLDEHPPQSLGKENENYIACSHCDAAGPRSISEEVAIEEWNRISQYCLDREGDKILIGL